MMLQNCYIVTTFASYKNCIIDIYERVIHRLVVCTKKQQRGFHEIKLNRPIRTLLLYENLRVPICARLM